MSTFNCSHCGQDLPEDLFRLSKNGHRRSPCRPCGAKYQRDRRKVDPAKFRKWDASKYAKHHDKIRARQNKRDRTADKTRQQVAYAASEELRKRALDRRNAWRKDNPEMMRAQSQRVSKNRRARLKGATVVESITAEHVALLMIAQHGLCLYCQTPMEKPTLDHFYPLSKGGHHSRANIVLACMQCNKRKHSKDPFAFLKYMRATS